MNSRLSIALTNTSTISELKVNPNHSLQLEEKVIKHRGPRPPYEGPAGGHMHTDAHGLT